MQIPSVGPTSGGIRERISEKGYQSIENPVRRMDIRVRISEQGYRHKDIRVGEVVSRSCRSFARSPRMIVAEK